MFAVVTTAISTVGRLLLDDVPSPNEEKIHNRVSSSINTFIHKLLTR